MRDANMDNHLSVISFILREINSDGNPEKAKDKFGIDNKKYNEILDVMKIDGYIKCDKIYMDGALNLDHATITNKGYNLMR